MQHACCFRFRCCRGLILMNDTPSKVGLLLLLLLFYGSHPYWCMGCSDWWWFGSSQVSVSSGCNSKYISHTTKITHSRINLFFGKAAFFRRQTFSFTFRMLDSLKSWPTRNKRTHTTRRELSHIRSVSCNDRAGSLQQRCKMSYANCVCNEFMTFTHVNHVWKVNVFMPSHFQRMSMNTR